MKRLIECLLITAIFGILNLVLLDMITTKLGTFNKAVKKVYNYRECSTEVTIDKSALDMLELESKVKSKVEVCLAKAKTADSIDECYEKYSDIRENQ